MVEEYRHPYRRNPLGADGRTPLFNPLMTYRRPAEVASRYLGVYETEGPNVLRQNNLPNHSIALGMAATEPIEAGDIVSISTMSNMVEKSIAGHGERILGVCAKDVNTGDNVEIVTFGPFTLRAISNPPVGSLLAASIEPGKATVVSPDFQGRIIGKTVSAGRQLTVSRITDLGFRTGRQPNDIKFDVANQRHAVTYHTPIVGNSGNFTLKFFNLRGIEVANLAATFPYSTTSPEEGSLWGYPKAIIPWWGTASTTYDFLLRVISERIGSTLFYSTYRRVIDSGELQIFRGSQISRGISLENWQERAFRVGDDSIAFLRTGPEAMRSVFSHIDPDNINTAPIPLGLEDQNIFSSVGDSALCWAGTNGSLGTLASSRIYALSGNTITPYSWVTVPADEANFTGEQAWRPMTSVITLGQDYHFIDFWNNNLVLYRYENLGSVPNPDYFVHCVLINLSGQSQFFPGERDYAVDALITLS